MSLLTKKNDSIRSMLLRAHIYFISLCVCVWCRRCYSCCFCCCCCCYRVHPHSFRVIFRMALCELLEIYACNGPELSIGHPNLNHFWQLNLWLRIFCWSVLVGGTHLEEGSTAHNNNNDQFFGDSEDLFVYKLEVFRRTDHSSFESTTMDRSLVLLIVSCLLVVSVNIFFLLFSYSFSVVSIIVVFSVEKCAVDSCSIPISKESCIFWKKNRSVTVQLLQRVFFCCVCRELSLIFL